MLNRASGIDYRSLGLMGIYVDNMNDVLKLQKLKGKIVDIECKKIEKMRSNSFLILHFICFDQKYFVITIASA